jgi:hypothetical protein
MSDMGLMGRSAGPGHCRAFELVVSVRTAMKRRDAVTETVTQRPLPHATGRYLAHQWPGSQAGATIEELTCRGRFIGRTENPGVGGSIPSLPTIFPTNISLSSEAFTPLSRGLLMVDFAVTFPVLNGMTTGMAPR